MTTFLSRQLKETEENSNYPHIAKLREKRLANEEMLKKMEGICNYNALRESCKSAFYAKIEAKSIFAQDAFLLQYLLSENKNDPLILAYCILNKKKNSDRII
eukprot:Tbor_TRINITY_DN5889_c0_g1::TRINITY_DN5889_c0_g1_i1::g.7299::m.7299